MKACWKIRPIGEVCEVVNGGTPKTGVAAYWDGKHQWITPAEMGKRSTPYIGETARKLTDAGLSNSSANLLPLFSVILSTRAPIGHLVINTSPMATNQGCKGLVPGKAIHHKFLFYFLSSIVDLLNDLGTGATFKELSGGKLKDVTVPIPPIPEQQRIVGILDEAFAGIATAKANAEKNLQNARALFESHLNSVFSQRGEGWVEKRLSDVCDLQNGYAFKSGDYIKASNTLNIRMSSIRPGGSFDPEHNQRFLPDSYVKEYAAFLLKDNDLIIAMTDMASDPKILGVPTLVSNKNGRNFLMNQRVGKLFGFSNEVRVPYLRYFLTSPSIKLFYKNKGAGGLQINISKGDILSAQIPLPSIAKQDSIVDQFDELSEDTKRLESIYQQKLSALEALKTSLQHDAFRGAL
jgi:type I restriction enzyme S subunit